MPNQSAFSSLNFSSNIFFDEGAWLNRWDQIVSKAKSLKRCARCLYGTDLADLQLDEKGTCSYCRTHDQLEEIYQTGKERGNAEFQKIVDAIKAKGRGKQYDLIVGVSGGTDSSYLIHLAVELGLRPLAVHFDNTWNTSTATTNIHRSLSRLKVPLETHVVDNKEYDDLYRAILQAGVIDLDTPTDLALAAVLNRAAEKHGVQYVFEGHSYRTEGLFPSQWLYMDARYVAAMHKRHGSGISLKTFPNLWLSSQLRWMLLRRIRKVRPLWYLPYEKTPVQHMLEKTYGWKNYGGHHLENRMTQFFHTYFVPRRFGIDTRISGFAALVRSGQMDRREGFEALWTPPKVETGLINTLLRRWGYNEEEFTSLMQKPIATYRDYPNYKAVFKTFRPFFYLMAKGNYIPMSFYLKYTR